MLSSVNSHVESLEARLFGNVVTISFSMTSGVANNTNLMDITRLESIANDYIIPVANSAGMILTSGSVWIERTNRKKITYYGSTTTERQYCSITYIAK